MSKEKLLLVGAGGFGRMVAEQAMLQYDCAFVDDGQPIGAEICGIPVIGGIASLSELRKSYDLLIAPSAYVSPYAQLGNGCVILQNASVQNGAVVGNGVLLNAGAEVHCDAVVEDYVLIYANSVIRTGAKVGRYARIGSNVTVCNSAVVPDGADIPDCTAVR